MAIQSFRIVGWFFTLAVSVVMAGCAGSLLSWEGATVEEPDRIFLQHDGRHHGSWQTRDLRIEYDHAVDKKQLNISGMLTLDKHLTTGFSMLEDLFLSLNFLDSEGKVIETHRLKNFSHRSWMLVDRMGFEKNLKIPEGTVSISFAYVGRVRDGGGMINSDGDSGSTWWDFWKVPRR